MNTKTKFKKINTRIGIIISIGLFFVCATVAQASWSYYSFSLPYTVGGTTTAIKVDVSSDKMIVTPNTPVNISWVATVDPVYESTAYCIPDNGPSVGIKFKGLRGSFTAIQGPIPTTYTVTCYEN